MAICDFVNRIISHILIVPFALNLEYFFNLFLSVIVLMIEVMFHCPLDKCQLFPERFH